MWIGDYMRKTVISITLPIPLVKTLDVFTSNRSALIRKAVIEYLEENYGASYARHLQEQIQILAEKELGL